MFDHVTIRVADRTASERFYDKALTPLGIDRTYQTGRFSEWQEFQLTGADDTSPVTRRLHVGFVAPSREQVTEFWRAGTEAGYADDGRPGPRPEYRSDYYGAFLLDPDGNSAEAVHHAGLRRGGIIDHLWIRVAAVAAAKRFYQASRSCAETRPRASIWRFPQTMTAKSGGSTRPRPTPATAATAHPVNAPGTTPATTPPTSSIPTATTSKSSTTTCLSRASLFTGRMATPCCRHETSRGEVVRPRP
jgi:catechol 2,3-dioxygenase-like lactoylglutathione lyase family enzyme